MYYIIHCYHCFLFSFPKFVVVDVHVPFIAMLFPVAMTHKTEESLQEQRAVQPVNRSNRVAYNRFQRMSSSLVHPRSVFSWAGTQQQGSQNQGFSQPKNQGIPQLACEKLQFLANQAVKHVIETTDNIGFKTLTNFDAHQEGFALPCIPQPLEDDSQGSALRGQFKPQQMVLLLFVRGLYFQIIQNNIAVVHLPLILINRSTAGSGNFTMRRLITNP